MTERKKLHIELLRMLAIFFVIMNHTGDRGQLYYLAIHEQPVHWLLMGFSALHKAAVPIFFLCAGALLLEKEESLGTLLKKRVLRFALVLLLFSLVAYLQQVAQEGRGFNVFYFVTHLYSQPLVYFYWYLYSYLGYLLMLPFLRRLARGMSDREYLYMLALWAGVKVLELLPFWLIETDLPLQENFVLFTMEYTVFFPLMGHFLEHRAPEKLYGGKTAALSALSALLAIAIMCLTTERWCRLNGSWPDYAGELYFGTLNFVVALALYLQAKTLFLRRQVGPGIEKTLTLFGSCSFGLYLLQQDYLLWLAPVHDWLAPRLGTYPACLLWVLLICLVGTVVTWLLKQIPGLKKLL